MQDTDDPADLRLTIRLPRSLDEGMRDSAAFFGRSAGAEWRAAAVLYRRALRLWTAMQVVEPESRSVDPDRDACARLVHELCDGVFAIPRPVEALHATLARDDVATHSTRTAGHNQR